MITVDLAGFTELQEDLKKLLVELENPAFNRKRAEEFRKYTQSEVATGGLGMSSISAGTAKIHKGDHPAEFNTGHLIKNMRTRTIKKSGEAGYFEGSRKYPGKTKKTITEIAILQHIGYRIPLQGEKGQRVRGFYAKEHGIHISPEKQFIEVEPRPFLFLGADKYEAEGHDDIVIHDYINRILF